MKGYHIILLGLLFVCKSFFSPTFAQNPDKALDPQLENTLLWEVKHPDYKKSSYLYGTIHIMPKKDFSLSEKILKRVKKSDRLVLEMKLDLMTSFVVMAGMQLERGKTLEDFMTKQDYKELSDYVADEMGSSMALFKSMKPFMLSQQVGMGGCIDMRSITSYETEFMALFDEDDRPISGLETAKEQLSFIDAIPMDKQIEGLMDAIRTDEQEADEMCKELLQMIQVYKKENLNELLAMTRSSEELGDQLATFLDNRNEDWIAKIGTLMEDKERLFIAVGAAHLPGEKGVINLLRKAGYTVNPIME